MEARSTIRKLNEHRDATLRNFEDKDTASVAVSVTGICITSSENRNSISNADCVDGGIAFVSDGGDGGGVAVAAGEMNVREEKLLSVQQEKNRLRAAQHAETTSKVNPLTVEEHAGTKAEAACSLKSNNNSILPLAPKSGIINQILNNDEKLDVIGGSKSADVSEGALVVMNSSSVCTSAAGNEGGRIASTIDNAMSNDDDEGGAAEDAMDFYDVQSAQSDSDSEQEEEIPMNSSSTPIVFAQAKIAGTAFSTGGAASTTPVCATMEGGVRDMQDASAGGKEEGNNNSLNETMVVGKKRNLYLFSRFEYRGSAPDNNTPAEGEDEELNNNILGNVNDTEMVESKDSKPQVNTQGNECHVTSNVHLSYPDSCAAGIAQ